MPLRVMDFNNHWSPTGGGVRRYLLQKVAHVARCPDVESILVVQSKSDATQVLAPNVTAEIRRAPRIPTGNARLLIRLREIRRLILRYRPDVIEVGSQYTLPDLIRLALVGIKPRPAVVGFWHADFPRTDIGRLARDLHPRLERTAESSAWWWARRTYGRMDAVCVASRRVAENLLAHDVKRLYYTPLAVDCQQFHPGHRDPQLVNELKAGNPERRTIFFPHRFSQEKGLLTLLAAYPRICKRLGHEPALVFAGDGPQRAAVQQAAERYRHVRYLGYLQSPAEISRWYASSDMSLALSAFETFGLSAAEAMASGLALVGANAGAAAELIEEAGCGTTVPFADPNALVDAICTLSSDPALPAMGRRARTYIEQFTWQATFNRLFASYRDVIARRQAGERVPAGLNSLGDLPRRAAA